MSGIGGQPGQANWAAGDTILGALVQYRCSLGLPASVLDNGVIEDVGPLGSNACLLDSLKANSRHTLHERAPFDDRPFASSRGIHRVHDREPFAAHACLRQNQLCIGVRSTLQLSAPNNCTVWKKNPCMAVYRNLVSNTSDGSSGEKPEGLKQFLPDCQSKPALLENDTSRVHDEERGGSRSPRAPQHAACSQRGKHRVEELVPAKSWFGVYGTGGCEWRESDGVGRTGGEVEGEVPGTDLIACLA